MGIIADEFDGQERLIRGWTDPSYASKIRVPTDHLWQSADGQESQAVMAWTGDYFSARWATEIHNRVVSVLGGDPSAWKWHARLYLTAYCTFFGQFSPATVLNAVTATPSRLRFRHWASAGKFALEQNVRPDLSLAPVGADLELRGLAGHVWLPVGGLEWAGTSGRPHRVLWSNRRCFRGRRFPEWRMFQANWDEDMPEMLKGRLPQLDALIAREEDQRRANTPMIHLWKVGADGQVEMLVFEVGRCGAMVSVRWSCQPFDCFMLAHKWYFEALRAALSSKERMWRRRV